MIRKVILIGIIWLLSASLCFSAALTKNGLTRDDGELAGLKMWDPKEKVVELYGEPDAVQDGFSIYRNYGLAVGTYSREYNGDYGERVFAVVLRGSNDLGTPRGIHVGSTLNDLLSVYAFSGSYLKYTAICPGSFLDFGLNGSSVQYIKLYGGLDGPAEPQGSWWR